MASCVSRTRSLVAFASVAFAFAGAVPTFGAVAFNAAFSGNGGARTGTPTPNNAAAINDQSGATQFDSSNAATSDDAITWTTPHDINKILIDFNGPTYSPKEFDVQVGRAGVTAPSFSNDGDWDTVQSYLTPQQRINLNVFYPTRYGIRIHARDKSNITLDGRMRVFEAMAWENYKNVATTATVTAPDFGSLGSNLGGANAVNNESLQDQYYDNNLSTGTNTIMYTWGADQTIGALAIHGGSGAPGEHLIAFKVQYNPTGVAGVGGAWVDLLNITNNALKMPYYTLSQPIMTDDLRLVISNADGGNDARVGEFFVFAVVPEPASAGLILAAAGAMLSTRRSRRVGVR